MSIASRIQAIEQHLTDDYNVLEVAGADLTNVNKNILNLKTTWQERLLYFMNNGTDVVWNNWEKVVGEGTTITLNNTEEAPMKIVLKGNTSQEGTPTPETPQDIHVVSGDNSIEVKGYNLYNANDTNAVANGYIIQSDGTLKLNEIDNTSGSSLILKTFTLPITQFKTNTTYTFVLEILSVSGSGHITTNESNATTQFSAISSLAAKTFDSLHAGDIFVGTATTKADFTNCTRALISYCYFLAGEKGSITFRLSIIEGSSVTPQTFIYQPYKSASYPINLGDIELCKIGTYQDRFIRTSGKNLFDVATWVTKGNNGTYYSYSNGVLSINQQDARSYINFVESERIYLPNGTYYLSNVGSATIRVYTDSSTIVSTNQFDVTEGYVYIKLVSSSVITCSPMINKGTSADNYEPYGTGWYVKKAIGKVVLDGSSDESWSYWTGNYYTNVPNGVGYDIVSDYFKKSVDTFSADYGSILYNGNSNKNMLFKLEEGSTVTNVNEWRVWLSNNNTTVYYVLATPTYTEITDTTLINQLETIKKSYEGQTNITQENNDMPFILDTTALKEM